MQGTPMELSRLVNDIDDNTADDVEQLSSGAALSQRRSLAKVRDELKSDGEAEALSGASSIDVIG